MSTVTSTVKAWAYGYNQDFPNVTLFEVERASNTVAGLLKRFKAAEAAVRDHLQGVTEKLNRSGENSYVVGIDVDFTVVLDEMERSEGIETISYDFREATSLVTITPHKLSRFIGDMRYPLDSNTHKDGISGLRPYSVSHSSLGVKLGLYKEIELEKSSQPERKGSVSIAGSNFKHALHMKGRIDDQAFAERLLEVARVNDVTAVPAEKFDRAYCAMPTRPSCK